LIELLILLSGCFAHLAERNPAAAQLLDDDSHIAGRSALYVHFRQTQRQRSHKAQPFFLGLRRKMVFAHLQQIEGEIGHPRFHRFLPRTNNFRKIFHIYV